MIRVNPECFGKKGDYKEMATKNAAELRVARQKMMLEDPLIKVVPSIAFPMMIAQLVQAFYGLVDTYFVSQLGTAATAAVGVNDSLMMFEQAIAMGIGAGASSYISRLLGAKDDKTASSVATTSLFIALGIGVLFAMISYAFMSPLIDIMGATASSKKYSMDFAKYILLGAPFTCGTFVLGQLLRAEGSTQFSMWGTVSGCVVNIILAPIFISVLKLEVAGAGMATSISKAISFFILLIPYLRKRSLLEINIKLFNAKWSIMKEVLRMSIPTFLRASMMSIASTVTNNVAGNFGDYMLAAMSVGNKVMRFLSSAIMGISQGIQPIAGFCWGAKKYRRVREVFWFIVIGGGGIALVFGLGVSFFAEPLIRFMTSGANEDAIRMGEVILKSQCYVLSIHMVIMCMSGVFQALGKAANSSILGLARSLFALIPCVVFLSMAFGEMGLAWSRAAADILSFFIALPMIIKLLNDLKKKVAEEDAAKAQAIDEEIETVEC